MTRIAILFVVGLPEPYVLVLALLSAGVMLSWSQENIRLPSPWDMKSAVWQAGGWWSRTTLYPTPRVGWTTMNVIQPAFSFLDVSGKALAAGLFA